MTRHPPRSTRRSRPRREDYRIGPPPKVLICFHSMQKRLGLGLGWRTDSVVSAEMYWVQSVLGTKCPDTVFLHFHIPT